jgi:hypothetical protein
MSGDFMLKLVKFEAEEINLSSLPHDTLLARQDVSLRTANTMLWMANHYKSLGLTQAMKSCAERGVEAVKEYQRITKFLSGNTTAIIQIA